MNETKFHFVSIFFCAISYYELFYILWFYYPFTWIENHFFCTNKIQSFFKLNRDLFQVQDDHFTSKARLHPKVHEWSLYRTANWQTTSGQSYSQTPKHTSRPNQTPTKLRNTRPPPRIRPQRQQSLPIELEPLEIAQTEPQPLKGAQKHPNLNPISRPDTLH